MHAGKEFASSVGLNLVMDGFRTTRRDRLRSSGGGSGRGKRGSREPRLDKNGVGRGGHSWYQAWWVGVWGSWGETGDIFRWILFQMGPLSRGNEPLDIVLLMDSSPLKSSFTEGENTPSLTSVTYAVKTPILPLISRDIRGRESFYVLVKDPIRKKYEIPTPVRQPKDTQCQRRPGCVYSIGSPGQAAMDLTDCYEVNRDDVRWVSEDISVLFKVDRITYTLMCHQSTLEKRGQ